MTPADLALPGEGTVEVVRGVDAQGRPTVGGIPVYGAHGPPVGTVDRDAFARDLPGARALVQLDGELLPVRIVDRVYPEIPATARWFTDARTGAPLAVDRTDRTAWARVYPLNPVVSDLVDVELPALVADDGLVGETVAARSCDGADLSLSLLTPARCWSTSAHATPDDAGDYWFDPDPVGPDDPFAEVQLYFHATGAAAWFADRGVDIPFLTANANFPWDNAFFGDFDGDGAPEVSFGEAEGVDLAYDGDVVTHEIGHAAVDGLAPDLPLVTADAWGLEWAGGAVNEGAADVFAALRSGDPHVGEYAGAAFGLSAIRDLTEVRRCPDDLTGEIHADGQIFGHFAWTLIDDPAVGPDLAQALLLSAIPRWGPGASWDSVGRSVHAAADELLAAGVLDDAQADRVLVALADSGMEGCPRAIPVDDGRTVRLLLFNGGLDGDLARLPGAVQLTLEVPDRADAVAVGVTGFEGDDGLGWAVYGRVGAPVEHAYTDVAGLGLGWATPAVWDWSVDGADADEVIWVDPRPLRGQRLYLSVASVNGGDLPALAAAFGVIGVRADATALRSGAGCGCSGSAGSGVGAAAGAALLAGRRRGKGKGSSVR